MQKDFEHLFYEAEDHYLQTSDITTLKNQANRLRECLAIYQCLRDQEISIFQSVADSLVEAFPDENSQRLEQALGHWMSVMRYGAMALLLNNPDYFNHRLLEWLTDMVHAQEMVVIETHLFECLKEKLEESFSSIQMALINPFLSQAKTILIEPKSSAKIENIGA
ncbi:phycobilisome protein [Crocosphaera sp. UHCC 0190]|uniref:phycobilisome protein n=1 Tax=Crocosphaera sp. UHCC 0190 TaxID=3110246 RepID=UPI002B20C27E|nr:phycobilisome protein [Crocosphaera sp. UHCC 0190]MEA5510116.1 phycobilisome protein [Crocosphaera sp. UHCC 0190]